METSERVVLSGRDDGGTVFAVKTGHRWRRTVSCACVQETKSAIRSVKYPDTDRIISPARDKDWFAHEPNKTGNGTFVSLIDERDDLSSIQIPRGEWPFNPTDEEDVTSIRHKGETHGFLEACQVH